MAVWPRSLFISVYFGDFPKYFPNWLRSCARNAPTFQWIIYHDQAQQPYKLNRAVYVLPYSREQMAEDFKRGYAIDIATSYSPRKLCEYRIFLYDLRKEIDGLDHFEYFGYTDIDMVYGDLLGVMPSSPEQPYAWVSAHPGRPCGPFTLFHDRCRERLRHYPLLEKVLKNNDYTNLDESEDFGHFIAQKEQTFSNPQHLQPSRSSKFNKRKSIASWTEQSLIVSDRKHSTEAGFFHFTKFKHKKCFKCDPTAETSEKMIINRWGIWNPENSKNWWRNLLLKFKL